MLEKVKVEFEEINAQRKQGNLPSANASSGSNRDIDNYVFFAYRQSRKNRVVDSVSDVSSSERFIIFSGSMSFWNSPSFSTSPIDEAVLSHSPAFSYDFNLPFDNVFRTGQFTGSVSMELTPAVTPRQSSGLVYLWNPGFAIAGARAAGVRNFWGGGTSCKKFVQNWNVNTFIFTDPFSNFSLVSIDALEPNLDQRSFRKVGSETNSGTTFTLSSFPVFINSENASSAESPYLLLPEDEIIFGLDCGVTPFGGAKTFSSITGSQMTISRKPCKITLFGSMVIDGIEKLPCLNQNLSSNSVHEIIGAEPVLDQFQIEPISSYYGSYLDNIITGSMATPSANTTLFTIFNQDNSRKIISRVSLGQAGTTGSLQRFVKMIDQSERTYDSCLPDIFTFVSQSDIGLTGSLIYIGQGVFDDSVNEYAKFLPNQFPFFGNPKRTIETDKATYLQSESTEVTGFIEAHSSILNGLARMKDLVFRTDWKIKKRSLFYPDPMAHRFKNSTESAASQRPFSSGTFRYGISNIDPEFSSTRWNAASFGQLRDMLEPRLGVTTSDGASPVKIHFVSGSTYNADPNNTHAQNISTFATSSIPWIDDGLFRNREDNPDETLLIF